MNCLKLYMQIYTKCDNTQTMNSWYRNNCLKNKVQYSDNAMRSEHNLIVKYCNKLFLKNTTLESTRKIEKNSNFLQNLEIQLKINI